MHLGVGTACPRSPRKDTPLALGNSLLIQFTLNSSCMLELLTGLSLRYRYSVAPADILKMYSLVFMKLSVH